MTREPLRREAFATPAVRVSGQLNHDLYARFRAQLDASSQRDLVVVELTTLGGDPEVARMMGEDVRFASEREPDRRFVLLGRAAVYSAGMTFMSFFSRENRYVTRGTRLMIHERRLKKEMRIEGPLTACLPNLQAVVHEIVASIAIQNEGFANLVRGSDVPVEEILKRAPENWYIEADEAKRLGLIEGVL